MLQSLPFAGQVRPEQGEKAGGDPTVCTQRGESQRRICWWNEQWLYATYTAWADYIASASELICRGAFKRWLGILRWAVRELCPVQHSELWRDASSVRTCDQQQGYCLQNIAVCLIYTTPHLWSLMAQWCIKSTSLRARRFSSATWWVVALTDAIAEYSGNHSKTCLIYN